MPLYQYKARDKFGALAVGTIESSAREAVATQLDSLGYIPVSIEEKRVAFPRLARFTARRVKPLDLIVFSRQLSTLISAGLPFLSSFDALIEQAENPALKEIILQVRRDVESGNTFADALAKHRDIFSPLFISMVRAGEVGGVLDEMLQRLATLLEHEAEIRARIKTATRYPKFVVVGLLIAIGILLTFVVPRFATMYDNFKVKLPLPTRILIGANHVFQDYWWLLALLGVGVTFAARTYVNTEGGRLQWDGIKIRLPVFGPIFLKSALSRFARVFGTLARSGMPILQALDIVADTVGNVVLARVIATVRDSVREGKGVVQPMRVSRVFPPVVVQMVAIGEEVGKLDEMLAKVSEYYDQEVDYSLKNLATSIEPILLVVIGAAVLFLALAIFMPWWNLINVFKGG